MGLVQDQLSKHIVKHLKTIREVLFVALHSKDFGFAADNRGSE
jgi:hypothetical protein